jgi:hypothetical protein
MKKYLFLSFLFSTTQNRTERCHHSFQSLYKKIIHLLFKKREKENTIEADKLLIEKNDTFEHIDKINKENKNNEIKKINIFIHGSSSGTHTYMSKTGPRPSLKGLLRNIKEQFNTEKKIKKRNENQIAFGKHKNRALLFKKNRLPLFIGIQPGLEIINETTVTKIAFDEIHLPFIKNKEKEISFMFNWDGDLSEKSRYIAGKNLRKAIQELHKTYQYAEINCFAHSHGGNVLLHSLQKKNNDGHEEKCQIHNCYLFGTPIGKITEYLIEHAEKNSYKKIINVFSPADYVQKGDITFSFGTLPKQKITKKSKHIYNVKLLLNNKAEIAHEDFFIYQKRKDTTSRLIIFFDNFADMLKEDQSSINESTINCSLNPDKKEFTFMKIPLHN